MFIISVFANITQFSVILPLIFFQKIRHIQDWTVQNIPLHQAEENEKPAQTTIAIQKGMYGLKLVMHQGRLDKGICTVILVDVSFQFRHGIPHVFDIRRNVAGIAQGTSGRANPVLRSAKFSRFLVRATDIVEKFPVHLSQQPVAQGKFPASGHSVLYSPHIACDLCHIKTDILLHISREHILKRALRTLNLGRKKRFLAQIHVEKKLDIGNVADKGVQLGQISAGLPQFPRHVRAHLNSRDRR